MHTNIHKRAKVGHVGHRPFQHHAGFEIAQGFDPFLKTCEPEFRSRIPPRFLQFRDDVLDSRQTELFCYVILGIQTTQERGIADDIAHFAIIFPGDGLDHAIGFRVHGGPVQGVLAAGNTQKTRRLLERAVPETGDLEQLFPVAEHAVLVAELNDVLGDGLVQARDPCQQWR